VEKCYKYFNCEATECKAHSEDKVSCWELEGTLCNTAHTAGFQENLAKIAGDNSKCKYCIYKKSADDINLLYKDVAKKL